MKQKNLHRRNWTHTGQFLFHWKVDLFSEKHLEEKKVNHYDKYINQKHYFLVYTPQTYYTISLTCVCYITGFLIIYTFEKKIYHYVK